MPKRTCARVLLVDSVALLMEGNVLDCNAKIGALSMRSTNPGRPGSGEGRDVDVPYWQQWLHTRCRS